MVAIPAAYPHKVNKVTISGTCYGASEIWSTGFYLGTVTADAPDPGTVAAAAVNTAWNTFFTTSTSKISNAYITTQVKVAQLLTDGSVDLDKVDILTVPTPYAGGGGTIAQIPQVTLAATMTSDNQRGLASKGRMYLPGINSGISLTTAKISSTDVNGIATNLKTFMDAINASTDAPGNVMLASKGHLVKATTTTPAFYALGKFANVTGLRVGDVYDTQRRRRDAFTETYTAKVLA